jgi:hypothetical protein
MPLEPLGYWAACRVVDLGRQAFFAHAAEDAPFADSDQIAEDDLLPQFGYVGSRYEARRVLLLGINPGNGPRAVRSTGDRTAMPALRRFVTQKTPASFVAAQQAYRSVCEGWAVWGRQCYELLRSSGLDMEDVAFTNALPWRTASQSAFAKHVAKKAAEHYTGPVVRELQPRIIVAVGKKAAQILEYAGLPSASVVTWNRAQALTQSVLAEREAATRQLVELLHQGDRAAT